MDLTLLLVVVGALLLAAPAQASRFAFDRAFGTDVDAVAPGTGYEVCTVAANCKGSLSGTLGGQFNTIRGMATDAAGNTYVADAGNRRIQKFDAAGNFVAAWGKDVVTGGGTGAEVCTVAANCKAGVFGGLGGEFVDAEGVAVDPSGTTVYVADGSRVVKMSSSGSFQRMWGKDVLSGGSTGPEICVVAANCTPGNVSAQLGGEFNEAAGVAVAPDGDVIVGEGNGHRVQRFDSNGTFERAWGKDVVAGGGTGAEICTVASSCKTGVGGALGGEFGNPSVMAVGPAGDIYVGDYVNQRLNRFDATGNFISTWGQDVDAGGTTGPEICTTASTCKASPGGFRAGAFSGGPEVATDAAGNVYAGDSNRRIQQFDAAGNFLMTWGKAVDASVPGTGFEVCKVAPNCQNGFPGGLGGEMTRVAGVDVDGAGNVYVAEFDANRLQKFVPAPDPPPIVLPSNLFEIGRPIGIRLPVTVPGPGLIELSGRQLKPKDVEAGAAGTYRLRLKLTKPAKEKLKRKGRIKLNASVAFTPTGGTENSLTKKLKLKR